MIHAIRVIHVIIVIRRVMYSGIIENNIVNKFIK